MSGFELNKIFAAVLVAVITALLAGFIAEKLSHPRALDTDAVFIEGAIVAAAGGEEQNADSHASAAPPVASSHIADISHVADIEEQIETAAAPTHDPAPASAAPPSAVVDTAKGKKLSKACAACHSFEKGGAKKMGPNLWGMVGAPKAGEDGYKYSAAMKGLNGEWSEEDLDKFLMKPKDFVPGTKMGYVGMKRPEDRAALIAWMKTLSD